MIGACNMPKIKKKTTQSRGSDKHPPKQSTKKTSTPSKATRRRRNTSRAASGQDPLIVQTQPSGINYHRVPDEYLTDDERDLIEAMDKFKLSKPGRKPKDLEALVPKDLYQYVEVLGHMGCTVREIAGVLGITTDTWYANVQRDPLIKHYYEIGKVKGAIGIRRAMHIKALQKNPTMLIWMGKQRLNQKEKAEVKVGLEEGNLDLSQLSNDELQAFKALVGKAKKK